MKKKMILTGLFGALVGVALSTLITLAISLMHNNGYYYAVVPELIAFCGSEVSAMLLQTLCSMLYGAIWRLPVRSGPSKAGAYSSKRSFI